jgi:hypothetical protein
LIRGEGSRRFAPEFAMDKDLLDAIKADPKEDPIKIARKKFEELKMLVEKQKQNTKN